MKNCGKPGQDLKRRTEEFQDSWRSPVRYPVRKGQEIRNEGAGSGYERERQARWDEREMRTATTKVRREVYADFQKRCQEQGRTPYAVLQELLIAWMRQAVDPAAEVRDKRPWKGWNSAGDH